MKHKTLRTLLCVILTVCFCLSAIVPASAAGLFGGESGIASQWDQWIRSMKDLKDRIIEKNPGADETPADPMTGTETNGFYRIVHLDCGRKYFSVENIKKLIDTMAKYGYNQLQLAFGNGGFRFILDEEKMGLSYDGFTMDGSVAVSNIIAGNTAFNGDERYLTETEMVSIIDYAKSKKIEIVPLINMPGHMEALLGGENTIQYRYSKSNVDISGDGAKYAYAILDKYAEWFQNKECRFFNFGADEYHYNEVTQNGEWGSVVNFINTCNSIVKSHGMISRIFNDAVCFGNSKNNTQNVSFNGATISLDSDIQICHWGEGYWGYTTSRASTLVNNGYTNLINTNGAWYYVLKDDASADIIIGDGSIELPTHDVNYNKVTDLYTYVYQSNGIEKLNNNAYTLGSMFCIWCDNSDLVTADDMLDETFEGNIITEIKTLAEKYWPNDISTEPGGDTTVVPISVAVGSSLEVKLDGNVAFDNITNNEYVTVTRGKPTTTSETVYKPAEFKTGTFYISNVANDKNPTKQLTFEKGSTDGYYYVMYDGKYIYPTAKWSGYGYSTTGNKNSEYQANIQINSDGTVIIGRNVKWYGMTYLTFDGTSFGGSETASNIYLYNQNTVTGATKTPITFTGKKVTPDNQPVVVKIGNTTYNVTVTAQNLTNVTLSVELWITNRYVGESQDMATETGHILSINPNSYPQLLNPEGISLGEFVPSPAADANGEIDIFWKGVVLHNGDKQYLAGTTASGVSIDGDKSGSGDDFLLIRYSTTNSAWEYYFNNEWIQLTETDTIIAYYMQKFVVSPEINTTTRDFGTIAGEKDMQLPGWTGYNGFMATSFAVVYPDYSTSPSTEDSIYKTTTMLRYTTTSNLKDGSLTPGVVYAENNSDYKISKITITRGQHTQNTAYWTTSDSITWEKKTNDAGNKWYNEKIVWEADKPGYSAIPYVNFDGTEWCATAIGNSFLILIYLEPVAKADNLNVVYWDDNAQTRINPKDIQIVVSEGTTFVNGLQNVEGAAAGATVTLPDNAYIVNSSGVQQKFNKDITIIEGVAANYRSGIYEYKSADISTDGKTLTLHYNLKAVADKHTYVVDFGLPLTFTDILHSFFGIKDPSTVEYLSVAKGKVLTESTGYFGSVVIDTVGKNDGEGNIIAPRYDTMTYTLDQKKTVSAPIYIPLYLKISGTTELQSTQIELIPASNVYYEETFITNPENSGWTNTATADSVEQTLEKSGNKQNVYGFDTKIENYYLGNPDGGKGITYSMGNALTTTLSIPAGAKEAITEKPLTFSFKGTGFDLISKCSDKTGILLVYIKGTKPNADGKPYKGVFLVDTYFAGDNAPEGSTPIMKNGTTVYQVPVVREFGAFNKKYDTTLTENAGLPYDTYQVSVYAYLNNNAGVFDNNAAAVASYSAVPMSDSSIIADALAACNITDIDADQVKLVYMDENSILNGGTGAVAEQSAVSMASLYAATVDSAEVYVDAFRVYNPLGDTTVQISNEKINSTETNEVQTYKDDDESGVKYMSLYDFVVGNLTDGYTNSNVYVEYDGNKPANEQIVGKEYKVHGPENEIYLAKGCGIAFHINQYSDGQTIQISAKAVYGERTTLNGSDVTATEMYYDLEKINAIQGAGTGRDIVIFNDGDGVLAISGLKCSTEISISANTSATQAAIKTIRYAMSAKEVSYAPATFEITAPETARRNRSIGIGVTATAADVDSMKIQVTCDGVVVGEETILYPYNVKAVEQGKATNYYYSKSYRFSKAGTYVFTATASDGNGNSYSIEKTVVVK